MKIQNRTQKELVMNTKVDNKNNKEVIMTLKEYIEKKETELKRVEKRPEMFRNGLSTIDDKLEEMGEYYDEELIREVGSDSYGEGYYDELRKTVNELKKYQIMKNKINNKRRS